MNGLVLKVSEHQDDNQIDHRHQRVPDRTYIINMMTSDKKELATILDS